MKRMKRLFQKLYFVPGVSLNIKAKETVGRLNDLLKDNKDPILLNLGCGDRFLGYRSLDPQKIKTIVKFDIDSFSSVDIVGDALCLPFKSDCFHGIICQAVLEHVEDPVAVVEGIHRTLREGGIVYVEIPFIQGYHPSPKDFYRFSLEGLEKLLSKFSRIDSGVSVGPSSALSWILREYFSGVLTGFSQNKRAHAVAIFIAGWMTFPIKYLDILFAKRPGAHRIASGLYFLGKKT